MVVAMVLAMVAVMVAAMVVAIVAVVVVLQVDVHPVVAHTLPTLQQYQAMGAVATVVAGQGVAVDITLSSQLGESQPFLQVFLVLGRLLDSQLCQPVYLAGTGEDMLEGVGQLGPRMEQ